MLYETEHYFVHTCNFTDPVLGEEVEGYGIFNKTTEVREAETRRLETAARFCKQFQEELNERVQRELEEERERTDYPIQ